MGVLEKAKSMLEGFFWLFRWGGLRYQLIRLEQRVLEVERFLQEMHRDPRDLRYFERKDFSQNGEDGILEEIFRRLGEGSRYFVEFGAHHGLECNCALLARERGWSGLFIEADDARFADLAANYRDRAQVKCVMDFVTSQNIEEVFSRHGVPEEFDLLSIDIDSNDYWVWKALCRWRPRVVVIEYNAAFRPPVRWVMKEDPNRRWDGTTYFGASLTSLALLGREKGYRLVGTDTRGINAFFVREDLAGDRFPDRPVAYHYSAPRYGMHDLGHPPGEGPFVEV